MTTIWQYLGDTIITGNFNRDYHDNQNIAYPNHRDQVCIYYALCLLIIELPRMTQHV